MYQVPIVLLAVLTWRGQVGIYIVGGKLRTTAFSAARHGYWTGHSKVTMRDAQSLHNLDWSKMQKVLNLFIYLFIPSPTGKTPTDR